MIGQVVLLRLANQYTLAAISAEASSEEADLRAFVLHKDGHLGVVEISSSRRGTGVDQWTEPPWPIPEPVAPPIPELASVAAELMPAASMPPMPPMPMMVIIRF
jgi:hypothetical protein